MRKNNKIERERERERERDRKRERGPWRLHLIIDSTTQAKQWTRASGHPRSWPKQGGRRGREGK